MPLTDDKRPTSWRTDESRRDYGNPATSPKSPLIFQAERYSGASRGRSRDAFFPAAADFTWRAPFPLILPPAVVFFFKSRDVQTLGSLVVRG